MTYSVYSNLVHDGRAYSRGDVIELSEAVAAPLIEAGVVGTEPVTDAPARAEAPAASTAIDATIGGTPADTGEPSLGAPTAPADTEAVDVTPVVSERLTREELETIARKEGVAADAIEGASTKASLVSLIEANRNPVTEVAAEAAADDL